MVWKVQRVKGRGAQQASMIQADEIRTSVGFRYRQEDEDDEFEHQPKSEKKSASSSSTPPPPKTINIAKIPAHLVGFYSWVSNLNLDSFLFRGDLWRSIG